MGKLFLTFLLFVGLQQQCNVTPPDNSPRLEVVMGDIEVKKFATKKNGNYIYNENDTLSVTLRISNVGAEPLTNVVLVDDIIYQSADSLSIDTLDNGEVKAIFFWYRGEIEVVESNTFYNPSDSTWVIDTLDIGETMDLDIVYKVPELTVVQSFKSVTRLEDMDQIDVDASNNVRAIVVSFLPSNHGNVSTPLTGSGSGL